MLPDCRDGRAASPAPASVFMLAQNLYYDGQVLAALDALSSMVQEDVLAAILFARIVHSETSASEFHNQAASRIARALSTLVLQPVVSKRRLDALVDVACCLAKHAIGTPRVSGSTHLRTALRATMSSDSRWIAFPDARSFQPH